MTQTDTILIIKKILVGALLVIIPILILWAGLKLTEKLLTPNPQYGPTVLINPK